MTTRRKLQQHSHSSLPKVVLSLGETAWPESGVNAYALAQARHTLPRAVNRGHDRIARSASLVDSGCRYASPNDVRVLGCARDETTASFTNEPSTFLAEVQPGDGPDVDHEDASHKSNVSASGPLVLSEFGEKVDSSVRACVRGVQCSCRKHRRRFSGIFKSLRRHRYEIDQSDPPYEIVARISNFLIDAAYELRGSIKRVA